MARKLSKLHFQLFRYQLLPQTQKQLHLFKDILSVSELKEKKNLFFNEVLSNFPDLNYRNAALNRRIDLALDPWFVVELNTEKNIEKESKDFRKEQIDNWPSVIVIFNNKPDSQLIAISKNRKAFASGMVVAKLLCENIQRELNKYHLTMQVEALFEKKKFWTLIEGNEGKVVSVNFELISPNMANISKNIKLDLRKINKDTNTHRTNFKLNASEGSALELNPKSRFVNSLVEYSSQGGGDIEVRLRGVKKILKTSKGVKETSIDEVAIKNATPERLAVLLDKF